MFVWTKEAELAYRIKYPHRKNERKEGMVATWDGKVLQSGTIVEGYASRGWLLEIKQPTPERKPKHKEQRKGCNNGSYLSTEEKRKRWYRLGYYFSQPGKLSLENITKELGYSSHSVINKFVQSYGKELAAKYGKLPYNKELKASYWNDIMEAAK